MNLEDTNKEGEIILYPERTEGVIEVPPELHEVFDNDSKALEAALYQTGVASENPEETLDVSEILAGRPALRNTVAAAAFVSIMASGCSTLGPGGTEDILRQSTEVAKTVGPGVVTEIVARKVSPVAGTALEIGLRAIELAEQAEVARQKDRFVAAVEEQLKNGGGEVVNEVEGLLYLLREAGHVELAEYIETTENELIGKEKPVEQASVDSDLPTNSDQALSLSPKDAHDLKSIEQKESSDVSSYDNAAAITSALVTYGPIIASIAVASNPALALASGVVDFIADRIKFSTKEEEDAYAKYLASTSSSSLLESGGLYYILEEKGRVTPPENRYKLVMDENLYK